MPLLVFAVALVLSAVLTRWVRNVAVAQGWVSAPNSERHVHTHAVPRLGGVAIFLTLWCMVLLARWVPDHFGQAAAFLPYFSLKIMGPASIVFLLGLVDDLFGLNAYLKFAVQAGAATLLYFNGLGISRLSVLGGDGRVEWFIGLPLTILWVLWITNAFNLIDGLDGLAAGSALFSTLVTCIVAMMSHSEGILFLTLVLAGAIAGFLRFNFNPASIFLGDCGSLLIGFLLSGLAIAGSQKSPTIVAVAIPIVSLGLPILDVTVAVLRRFLSGQRLFRADREHIHHKLLRRGVSHKQTVLVLYGVSACFGLLSLLLLNPGGTAAAIVLVVCGVGVMIGVRQLKYPEFLELGRVASRALNQRHVIANHVNLRKAQEALGACTTPEQFCQIMQDCLQTVGFDGFGLNLAAKVPAWINLHPLMPSGGSKFAFFWSNETNSSETNWSLTFRLPKQNGRRLGKFTLFRKNAACPLWLDLDVFTGMEFSSALAAAIRKMQDAQYAEARKQKEPGYAVDPMMGSGGGESLVARAS
jgi:UDP-GlcNAc:undecaprenyl-phosphate/decaprenyl-phosphate GlcNAc-1-phosphate transferase